MNRSIPYIFVYTAKGGFVRELRVGFESALDFWRVARIAAPGRIVEVPEGKIYGARELSLSEQVSLACNLCNTEPPLDVVVPDAAHRHAHASLTDHVWQGPIGAERVFGLGSGIEVCRIPLVIVQLACSLDEIELVELGLEMSGTYGLSPRSSGGEPEDCRPLVSPSELREYALAARALGVRGAAAACRAMEFVVPNSNSPRETDIAIAFQFSRRQGGLMVGGFEMNKSIRLPESLAEQIGQSVIKPDFSWDNGTVVEYDSEQEHRTPEARARDERKRRAYQSVGMDCLTLTNDILRSNERYEWFAGELERSLGISRRDLTPAMAESRRQLRERLFGPETEGAALTSLALKA